MPGALLPSAPKIWNHPHHQPHCCPVWLGYVLASPLRRLVEDPDEALARLVKPGDHLIEVGPAMGFFTLPLARRVGPSGQVVCVELASGMIQRLQQRVDRARLTDRVTIRQCRTESLAIDDLQGSADGALLMNVLHELSDPPTAITELHAALAPGGFLLLVEPAGHCSKALWNAELELIAASGFRHDPSFALKGSRRLVALFLRE